jgi:cytochrome c peroxidase
LAVGLGGCGEDRVTVTRLPALAVTPQAEAGNAGLSVPGDEDLNPRLLRRFKALAPRSEAGSPALVELGRLLYFEPLLSGNGKVSCNSCHPLDHYGTTHSAVSAGVGGRLGRRNAPTTYNAALQFTQFWDGRAANTKEQVKGPLMDAAEMDMKESLLSTRLSAIEGYRKAFGLAFPGASVPISLDNVSSAIAEFERGLTTPARWDRYLSGDRSALTAREKAGAKIFANLGCMVCHEGQLLGGSMFQRVGVIIPWPNQRDRGRGELTHNAADDMTFKVPSLRNVAATAPYFHDGSVGDLAVAIQMMARHQLGVSLTDDETLAIESWMKSLTGVVPADYVRKPALPPASRP